MNLHAEFYNHGILHLAFDVFLALVALGSMRFFCWVAQKEIHVILKTLILIPTVPATILALPNALYLAYEFRHIVKVDHVADDHPFSAIVGFGILSIIGGILAIWSVRMGASLPAFRKGRIGVIIVLSFLSGIGTVYGALDYNSWDAIFRPEIIVRGLREIVSDTNFVLLTLGLSAGLSILCLVTDKVPVLKKWISKALKGTKKVGATV